MLELFTIDEKTRVAKPNPELLMLLPFKELMRRLRRVEGDSDGREKLHNSRELAYIYYAVKFCDTKEDEDKYKKMVGLPEDWEPDDVVKQAMDYYRETQYTPAIESVKLIKESIRNLNSFISQANQQLKVLTIANGREVNEFLDVLDRLPKTIETLKKAESTLEREQEALAKGRKGRSLNKFEMPN